MEKLYYKLKNKLYGYSDFENKLYKSYYAYKSMCNWASGYTEIASQYENWHDSVIALAKDEKVIRWVLERRKCLDDYGYKRIILYADKARRYLFPIILAGIVAAFDIKRLCPILIACSLFVIAMFILLAVESRIHKDYIISERFYQDVFAILDGLEKIRHSTHLSSFITK